MRDLFDPARPGAMDDSIANGTFEPSPGEPRPSHCSPHRVDYSLHRCVTTPVPPVSTPELRTVHQLPVYIESSCASDAN